MPAIVVAPRGVEDFQVLVPLDDQVSGKPSLSPRQGVVDENVTSGNLAFEFDDVCRARKDDDALDNRDGRAGDRSQLVGRVENLPDYVKARGVVWGPDTEVDSNRLTNDFR